MCCPSSSLHLSRTFRVGCSEWFPGSLWPRGQDKYPMVIHILGTRRCPALLLRESSLYLLSSKLGDQSTELEQGTSWPGRASQQQAWLGSDNLPPQTAHSLGPWAFGGQAWVSQEYEYQWPWGLTQGVHYHPSIRVPGTWALIQKPESLGIY